MPLSLNEIRDLIDRREFDKLIGEAESQFLDAKLQPYIFEKGNDIKRELAKDISAFANASGGYILIGIATAKAQSSNREEITEIVPFLQNFFDEDRHRKILGEWLFPTPQNLEMYWVQYKNDPDKGIAIIFIPPQEESSKPYLITKSIGDKKSTDLIVGYVVRRIDGTEVHTVQSIQQALRTGLNFEREILARVKNIEAIVSRQSSATVSSEMVSQRKEKLKRRLELLIDHPVLKDSRILVVMVTPIGGSGLESIFSEQSGSIRRQLEAPPTLRSSGWSLQTANPATSMEGEFIRVDSSRFVADLYRDGDLLFGARIDRNFIGWSNSDLDWRIHPLALIEVIDNLTRFYQLVLDDFFEKPTKLEFCIQLRNMHLEGKKTRLHPGVIGNNWMLSPTMKEAPQDFWQKKIVVDFEPYNPDRIAFLLIREIYIWFGHSEEAIPYTVEGGAKQAIDAEAIKGIG